MNIPDEFHRFCLYIHQESAYVYGPDPQDWIEGALAGMSAEQRTTLRAYVDHLLSGPYTEQELQAIWSDTDAEMGFRDERSLRNFLGLIRDTIDRSAVR